jgi:hypothetical protein
VEGSRAFTTNNVSTKIQRLGARKGTWFVTYELLRRTGSQVQHGVSSLISRRVPPLLDGGRHEVPRTLQSRGQNPDEGFWNLLPRELNALLRSKSKSTLVEAWTPGGSGAVLIT